MDSRLHYSIRQISSISIPATHALCLGIVFSIFNPQRSFADPCPPGCQQNQPCNAQVVGVPPGTSCEQQVFTSKCYRSYPVDVSQTGFPLNIGLGEALGPPDFPPRKIDPTQSSMPLVSSEGQYSKGPSPIRERPMHGKYMDLITGQPLLESIDFELPFGSAMFRHVRTYSENPAAGLAEGNQNQPVEHRYWDWNGLCWMMGENPLFLIDASYQDVVTPDTKRCYFIPDAHHAIPFRWDEVQEKYFAPPWFDAVLEHNNTVPPTHFVVSLDHGSIRYTFEAIYDDLVTPNDHEPPGPPNFGRGYPYYGRLIKIEDRFGNAVEYDYCEFEQVDCGIDDPSSCCCHECCQNCNEKGQIRAIKLRTAANSQVAWTLIYTHRAFGGIDQVEPWSNHAGLLTQHALHSIHVYEGDVPSSSFPACLTLPFSLYSDATTLSEIEAIDAVGYFNLPTNWVIEAKYLYNEVDWGCAAANIFVNSASQANGYQLIKSTVTRRQQNGTSQFDVLDEQNQHYRYAYWESTGMHHHDSFQLVATFENSTLQSIIETMDTNLSVRDRINSLIVSPDDTLFQFPNPVTGGQDSRSLIQLADLRLKDREEVDAANLIADEIDQALVSFFQGDQRLVTFNNIGKKASCIKGASSTEDGSFVYYYFIKYPETFLNGVPPGQFPGGIGWYVDNVFTSLHYPYHVLSPWDYSTYETAPLTEPFFITVIDEIDALNPSLVFDPAINSYDPTQPSGIRSRRVVEMNATGVILRDRTWKYSQQGVTFAQEGIAEDFKFDCKGRMSERRTRGWNSPENTDPAHEGLIYVYKYEEDFACPPNPCSCSNYQNSNGRPGELAAEGIKSGTDGQVYYTKRIVRGVYDGHQFRSELIKKEIEFPEPVSDPFAQSGNTTDYYYEFGNATTDPYIGVTRSPPIKLKRISRPAVARTAGGPLYFSVDKTKYDDNGNEEWSGRGSLIDASNLGTALEFYVSYTQRDDRGRPMLEAVDTDQYSVPGEFYRVVSDAVANPPLNLITTYEYSDHGPKRIVYPNLRERLYFYLSQGDEMTVVVYNDLVRGPGQEWSVLSPARRSLMKGGRLKYNQEVKILDTSGDPDGQQLYEVISTTEPEYDPSGRPNGIKRTGHDQSAEEARISYNGFGQVDREQMPDGSLTRNVYDSLGRLERVYRGSKDFNTYWGTAEPWPPPCPNPPCPNPPPPPEDNMVLVEKRYYGEGVNDAYLLNTIRNYRDKPINQYYQTNCDPPCPENNEDSIGWISKHEYDRRMREVWLERQDAQHNPLTYTVTWFDNQGRTRLIAEYGNIPPANGSVADPRALNLSDSPPSASSILALTPKPTSLTETIYNARGQSEEYRQYNVENGTYLCTLRYYGYGDKLVENRSPGLAIAQYEYDAKGRRIVNRSLAVDAVTEATKSRTIYDLNDRIIQTIDYERMPNAIGNSLNTSNSVRSFTHNWYDKAGRVIAVAKYGANNATFSPTSPGSDPVRDEAVIPTSSASVLVTRYEYDEAGRQNRVTTPDGVIAQTEYDDLGRIVLSIENAESQNLALVRRTAYQYDQNGRLIKIAAITPEQGNITSVSQVNWEATNGSIQVTSLYYGAEVVDSTHNNAISSSERLVAGVLFPNPATGQPSFQDFLNFSYFSNGSVARRFDSRQDLFQYEYDESERLFQTTVDDSDWYSEMASIVPDMRPKNRVRRIEYDYTPDGFIQEVKAFTRDSAGTEQLLSINHYEYDSFHNLKSEAQAHGAELASSTPKVEYHWDFSPMAQPNAQPPVTGYNFNRLTRIDYPFGPSAASGRQVAFHYGNDQSDVDSSLNRITSIETQLAPGAALSSAAEYAYMGSNRRVSLELGCGISQNLYGGTAPGLDRFGRITDLNYKLLSTGNSLQRYQYGYDNQDSGQCGCQGSSVRGNIRFARIDQAQHQNDRSWVYQYDALARVTQAEMGQLSGEPSNPQIAAQGSWLWTWALDILGNWSAGINWRRGQYDQDPDLDLVGLIHQNDNSNRLTDVQTVGIDGDPSVQLIHDISGNIVYDGDYVYQYDAWSRLLQVNKPGDATFEATTGKITGGNLGDFVAGFTYDGLGRLIQKTTPITTGITLLQSKHYYYDGVRRIQEVIDRPEPNVACCLPDGTCQDMTASECVKESGSPRAYPTLCDQAICSNLQACCFTAQSQGQTTCENLTVEACNNLDGTPQGVNTNCASVQCLDEEDPPIDPLPIGEDELVINAYGEGEEPPAQMIVDRQAMQLPPFEIYIDREYVYGPSYVDEYIAQFDRDAHAIFMIQDSNYNVVALVAGEGLSDGNEGELAPGTLLEQYAFEPYGGLVAVETFAPHAVNRVGHQGLFFERFDGNYNDQTLSASGNGPAFGGGPGFVNQVKGLYYNRNRYYSPWLGRFTSRDPNSTGHLVLSTIAMNGHTTSILLAKVSGKSLFADGLNRFTYVLANPLTNRDPLGLMAAVGGLAEINVAGGLSAWIRGLSFVGTAALVGVGVGYLMKEEAEWGEVCCMYSRGNSGSKLSMPHVCHLPLSVPIRECCVDMELDGFELSQVLRGPCPP